MYPVFSRRPELWWLGHEVLCRGRISFYHHAALINAESALGSAEMRSI